MHFSKRIRGKQVILLLGVLLLGLSVGYFGTVRSPVSSATASTAAFGIAVTYIDSIQYYNSSFRISFSLQYWNPSSEIKYLLFVNEFRPDVTLTYALDSDQISLRPVRTELAWIVSYAFPPGVTEQGLELEVEVKDAEGFYPPLGIYTLSPIYHCLTDSITSRNCMEEAVVIFEYQFQVFPDSVDYIPPNLPQQWGQIFVDGEAVHTFPIPFNLPWTTFLLFLMIKQRKKLDGENR